VIAVLRPGIKNPLPNQTDHNLRQNRRNIKNHAIEFTHADILIAGQRQGKRQNVLKCQRDQRDVSGVPHRTPPNLITHQILKVLQANELTSQTDAVPLMHGKIKDLEKRINVKNSENRYGGKDKKKILGRVKKSRKGKLFYFLDTH
jgi:hypothetical protein